MRSSNNRANGVEIDSFKGLFAEFAKHYPNITVDFSPTGTGPTAAYNEKLVSLLAGGDAPDAFKTAPNGFGQIANSGAYLALDDYVQRLDDQVSAVLAAVRSRFGDNALVLFTADHGEMLGNHRLWGKNNCAYEDVWNVPLLARFPAGSASAALHETETQTMVSLVDLAPTCLRAAGVDDAMPLDGRPLEEQVRDGGRDVVIAEGEGFIALGDGTTKYVTARRGGQRFRELIDLAADAHEFRNVIDQPAYAARHLRLADALERTLVDALLP